MDELVNTRGRGSLGTATNSPVSDANTMARTQNRPSAPHGATDTSLPGPATPGSGVQVSKLSESDRAFIREIHNAHHLDGTPFTLSELQFMRSENGRYLEQALRELGPRSSTVGFFQEVIAAYDERIADAKSPMGRAIDGLKRVLADPNAKEKDRRDAISIPIGIMRQDQLLGQDDPAKSAEAMDLIGKLIKQDAKEKAAALDALVNQEKRSSGSVSEEQFRKAIIERTGTARQEALMGLDDDETGPSSGLGNVIEAIDLVADRRVATLKGLIAQEKQFPNSVSEQQFVRLVQAVLGDDRQKQVMGVSDSGGSGLEPVLSVMKIILQRRLDAITDLFKRQNIPGSGVTNKQIEQAIKDYESAKKQAMQLGISVPNAPDIPDQDFKIEPGPPAK